LKRDDGRGMGKRRRTVLGRACGLHTRLPGEGLEKEDEQVEPG